MFHFTCLLSTNPFSSAPSAARACSCICKQAAPITRSDVLVTPCFHCVAQSLGVKLAAKRFSPMKRCKGYEQLYAQLILLSKISSWYSGSGVGLDMRYMCVVTAVSRP